jgi:adenine-specific DNA-methyltransferase
VYINNENGKIEKIGDPLPVGTSSAAEVEGCTALLPIRQNGTEGNWQWSVDTFKFRMAQGRVRIGGNAQKGFTIYILKDGEYSKITNGEFEIIGHGVNGEIICEDNDSEYVMAVPGDIWKIASHDSTQYGSRLISNIFGDRRFTFPKSLYAVKDCLYFFTAYKPNALIVDFFAGSGTTLHAVNLLNAEDGGHRRCIMVTNNEVSVDEAKALTEQGHKPGDPEWEALGIARYVTWPRTVCSIEGHNVNGAPLKGNYIGSDRPMADGFPANCEYFKLGFLDRDMVSLGRQFQEILPLLWMKSGAIGKRPEIGEEEPVMLVLPENHFAVLVEETAYAAFAKEVRKYDTIDTVYFVTNSESAYHEMSADLGVNDTYQLYRDYIDNFMIGARRDRP